MPNARHDKVTGLVCCSLGHEFTLSDKHDAVYCPMCNIWLEGKCDDYLCYFCVGRPEKPND